MLALRIKMINGRVFYVDYKKHSQKYVTTERVSYETKCLVI